MKNSILVDDLTDWSLYLNEGFSLNDDFLESIKTISKGFINDIGVVIIGDSSFDLFNIDENIDFDLIDDETHKNMQKTLNEHPDFNSGLLFDKDNEICGGVIQMNSGVINIINKDNLDIENDSISFGCCLIARSKLICDCENNTIYGYLIPKKEESTNN